MTQDTSIFTNSGKQLILDAAASKTKIIYTKAVLAYDHAQNHTNDYYKGLTKLDDIRKEVPINISVVDKNTIRLGASFSNKDLYSNVFYNIIGWYAKNEAQEDILVAIITLDPQTDSGVLTATNADDGGATTALDYYLNFTVDDAENVTINAADAGSVSHPEMNFALESKADKQDVNTYNKDSAYNPSIDYLNGLSNCYQYVTSLRPAGVLGVGDNNPIHNALVITTGGNESSIAVQLILGEDGQLFGRIKEKDEWSGFVSVNGGALNGFTSLLQESTLRENADNELNSAISKNSNAIDAIKKTIDDNKTDSESKITDVSSTVSANKATTDKAIDNVNSTIKNIQSLVDTELATKADADKTFSRDQVMVFFNKLNSSLENKADRSLIYDKTEVDNAIKTASNTISTKIENKVATAKFTKTVNGYTPDSNGNIDLKVGGVNLIRGSDMSSDSVQKYWTVDTSKPNATVDRSGSCISILNADVTQKIAVEPNTTYTFSFFLGYLDGGAKTSSKFFFVEYKDTTFTQTTSTYVDHQFNGNAFPNTWGRSDKKLTFTTQSDCHAIKIYIRQEDPTAHAFEVKDLQLEVGNIATDYAPAPKDYEDYASNLTTVHENLLHDTDTMSRYTRHIHDKALTTGEYFSREPIDSNLSNLNVTQVHNGSTILGNAGLDTIFVGKLSAGTYTYSVYIRSNNATVDTGGLRLETGQKENAFMDKQVITGTWQLFKSTFTLKNDYTNPNFMVLPYNADNALTGGSLWYAMPKLEMGPVATGWTPNTSDITSRIAQAGKVKTVNGASPDDSGNINVHTGIVREYDVAKKQVTKVADETLTPNKALVDAQGLSGIADAINNVNGNRVYTDAKDVNTLTGQGVYILKSMSNTNTPSFYTDKRGTLVVYNYDNNAKTQIWVPAGNGNSLGIRYWEGNNYKSWYMLVSTDHLKYLPENYADVVTGTIDLNNYLKETRVWKASAVTLKNGLENIINEPGRQHCGWIKTVHWDDNSTQQYWIEAAGDIYMRCGHVNSMPTGWIRIASSRDIDNLQNQINQLKNQETSHVSANDTDALNYSKAHPGIPVFVTE